MKSLSPFLSGTSFAALCALLLAAAGTPAADLEGVGRDMGYRLFGDAKKNKPVLLQNSRGQPVQYFDDKRGVFETIPAFSDVEVECRGKARRLNVRYRDAFRETAPFQITIECGREVQFMAPQQVAPPRPVAPSSTPDIVVEPLSPPAAGGSPESAGGQ